jgi:hypothetical protein
MVGQGPGHPEAGQGAGGEHGHGADPGAGQGDDQQAAGVQDAGVCVRAVDGEGGLAVGPGLDQLVAVAVGEQLPQAPGGDRTAAVLERWGGMDSRTSAGAAPPPDAWPWSRGRA